jgi:hypothetical protein
MFTRNKSVSSATSPQAFSHFVPLTEAFMLPEGKPMLEG